MSLAPFLQASKPTEYVLLLWPTLGTIPLSLNDLMRFSELGSSGASVTILTSFHFSPTISFHDSKVWLALRGRFFVAGTNAWSKGAWMFFILWAPFLVGQK